MNHDFGLSHYNNGELVGVTYFCSCGWLVTASMTQPSDPSHHNEGVFQWQQHRDEAIKPLYRYHHPRCNDPVEACVCADYGFDRSASAVNVIEGTPI